MRLGARTKSSKWMAEDGVLGVSGSVLEGYVTIDFFALRGDEGI